MRTTLISFIAGFLALMDFCHAESVEMKDVPYDEVIKLEREALVQNQVIPNRVSSTHEIVIDQSSNPGSVGTNKVWILERTPPGRHRFIIQENVNFDGSLIPKRTENLYFDGKLFLRTNDGSWQELEPPADYAGKFNQIWSTRDLLREVLGHDKPTVQEVEYSRLVGTTIDIDSRVSAYETKIATSKQIDGSEIPLTITSRYWFLDDGKLSRIQVQLETAGDLKIEVYNFSYEYGDIKIESPT